ncbi:hypothetical protein E4U42_000353 [Claviceps africana]|uniref:Uncharacterized protein n=1 Tax=Claviceps africana TaxID=83212 RepID=A0A8K0J028_9HYPO|nr:hypothetical protein E4U42_000353 [Claviceps africana]
MVTDLALELLMLEPTTGYFESLRHTMVGLQTLSQYRCLLSPYLFEPKPDSVSAPQYLRQIEPGEPSSPRRVKTLDKSQLLAFEKATTGEVALIQGPPGTGKTYTSNVILESVVDTLNSCQDLANNPIVVVAQTNHAVDQLMKKYIEDRGSDTVIRLGGRGGDDMKAFSLGERMYRSKNSRGQSVRQFKAKLKDIIKSLENAGDQTIEVVDAITLKNLGLLDAAQYESLVDDDEWESAETPEEKDVVKDPILTWLGDAYTPSASQREQTQAGRAGDRRQRGANIWFVPLPDSPAALPNEDYAKYLLEKSTNLYEIRPDQRLTVYRYLLTKLRDIQNPRSGIVELLTSYTENCKSMREVKERNRAHFIQEGGFKVIACTATGLLKYRNIIAQLRPRVLLMEEAAEIREADTIAACLCFPTLEHLILLGDHQQLQPHVNLHELSRDPYRINISMFERLIKIGISHQTLLEQRRMIPPLRNIVQIFYPNVIDSPSISKLCTAVPGVLQPLWWFQHDWQESRSKIGSDCTSIENPMEAKMVVLFVQYLVEIQNIHPRRITMLTFYNGQVRLIKGELARNTRLASRVDSVEWSVRTVDGFQGEENDFILLSLVRGPNGVPGFLASDNRTIVALSRARLGLYLFGHRDVLLRNPRSRQTWSNVIHKMRANSGRTMPLCVDGKEMRITQLDDWKPILQKSRSTAYGAQDGQRHADHSPVEECFDRSSCGAPTSENEADMNTMTGDAMTTRGRIETTLPLQLESPPSPILEASETSAAETDSDLIYLTDAVTIPLSIQPLDMRSLSLDTPVLALQAEEDEEALIEFSDDEDVKDAAGTIMSSTTLIDLLD